MFKKIIVITLLCLFTSGMAYGKPQGTGEKTADAVISAGPCKINSVQVITNGQTDAKLILYDIATEADGRVITEISVSGTALYDGRYWIPAELCLYGIYADIDGSGASYIISKEN